MYIGLVLLAWIALAIALVAWMNVRAVPQRRAGSRRRQAHQQAIATSHRSAAITRGVAGREGIRTFPVLLVCGA